MTVIANSGSCPLFGQHGFVFVFFPTTLLLRSCSQISTKGYMITNGLYGAVLPPSLALPSIHLLFCYHCIVKSML